MNTRTKILSAAITSVIGTHTATSHAALPSNAILEFDTGVVVCNAGAGTPPDACAYGTNVSSGSFFSMDTNGNGTVQNGEKTAIGPLANVILGTVQPASGSHIGEPDGSESPGIDQPWKFFGNTGMHQTTKAVSINVDDSVGNVTLDFTGWNVTWNGISSIPMGGDSANFGTSPGPNGSTYNSGEAVMTCGNTCEVGDTFLLTHAAQVPKDDPSNFGGVKYVLNLSGTISVPDPLSCAGCSSVDQGTTAASAGSGDWRLSMADLVSNGRPEDTGYSYAGGLYDFIVTGATPPTQVLIPLTAPIPAAAVVDGVAVPPVYRKLKSDDTWVTFVADANNLIASAARVSGSCPAVGDAAYDHTNGLVEGDSCLQLTIEDDGIYDDDTVSANTIADPGGVATAIAASGAAPVAGTSGCSLSNNAQTARNHADWWLVAGFIAMLGFMRRKVSSNR